MKQKNAQKERASGAKRAGWKMVGKTVGVHSAEDQGKEISENGKGGEEKMSVTSTQGIQ